jgi:hydrogenase-4 component E
LLGLGKDGGHYLVLAGVVLLIKAIGIPLFLSWSARRMGVWRDAGAHLRPTVTLLFGGVLLGVGYFLAPQFAVPTLGNGGAAGMTITLLLIGMLLMITRRLALSQIIGFLVLENGIFLYGLTQTHGMPMLLEMGVVFEVLVCVLVAGLVIFRLSRSFEHIDVTGMRGLRH